MMSFGGVHVGREGRRGRAHADECTHVSFTVRRASISEKS